VNHGEAPRACFSGEDIVILHGRACLPRWKRGVFIAFIKPAAGILLTIWAFL
jgi:hypothetical protein